MNPSLGNIIAHKEMPKNRTNLNLVKTLSKMLHGLFENNMVDLSELLIARSHCTQEVWTNGLVST